MPKLKLLALSFFSAILLFSFVTVSNADECNPSAIPPDNECYMSKASADKSKPGFVIIKNLRLSHADEFKVDLKGTKVDVNCFSDCLLVLPPQDSYNFSIKTSKDFQEKRSLTPISVIAEKSLAITELTKFSVIFKKVDQLKDPILFNTNNDDEAILVSTDALDVTAQSVENGKVVDQPVSLDNQDFLSQTKKFQLTFKINSTQDFIFNFELLKANKNCSSLQTVKDKIDLKTADANAVLSKETLTCVYAVTADDGSNLEIAGFDLKTTSNYDTVTIKDGLKLTSNDLINSNLNKASSHLNQLDQQVSSKNNILVILTTSFVPNQYEQSTVTIKKSSLVKVTEPKNVKITTDRVYVFDLTNLKQHPILTFEKGSFNLTNTNLTIQDRLYGEKILEIHQNDIVNSELWSESNVLVLNFTSAPNPVTIDVKLTGQSVSCNKLATHPSTFVLNATEELTNQTCYFYFQPQDVTHSVILNENLMVKQGACITLKGVKKQTQLFNVCNKDVSDGFEANHLPEIVLPSNDSYVIIYQQGQNYKNFKFLVQATFSYNGLPLYKSNNLTSSSPKLSLTSVNYPNNYPYYLGEINEMLTLTSDSSYVYGSFEDYNLRPADSIYVLGSDLSFTHASPDDFLIGDSSSPNTTQAFSLTTKFDASKSLLIYAFGKGFKINFERVNCVLNFDPKTKTVQTPNYPKKFENASDCLVIIDLSKEKDKYLELQVENGNEQQIDYGVGLFKCQFC